MLNRRIAVILAADVAGYSRLVAQDEEGTLQQLYFSRALLENLIARAGGRVFNTAGDAIMAEFKSAVDAVRCAIEFQERMGAHDHEYPETLTMRFRIGVTIGDVVEREGDLLGDGVNVAARLESVSPEGGLAISASIYEVVSNKIKLNFLDRGLQRLKNLPSPIHIFVYTPPPPAGSSAPKKPASRAALLAGGLICLIGAGGSAFLLMSNKDETPAPKMASSEVTTQKIGSTTPQELEMTRPAPAFPAAQEKDRSTSQLDVCLNGPVEKSLASCQQLAQANKLSSDLQARVELKLGIARREAQDITGAIEALTQSISHASSSEAFNQRGIAHFALSDFKQAIADFSDALRLDPDNGEALNNRAWTYFNHNLPYEGLEDANRAVELLGDRAFVWDTRGHINESLGNRQAALNDYRKALSINPALESSRDGLARLGNRK